MSAESSQLFEHHEGPVTKDRGLRLLRGIRDQLETRIAKQIPTLELPTDEESLHKHIRLWHTDLDLGRWGTVSDIIHDWQHDVCTTHNHHPQTGAPE